MATAMTIIAVVGWALTVFLAIALCKAASRGDEINRKGGE